MTIGKIVGVIALSALVVAVCLLCGCAVARFRGEMVMRSSSPTFLFVLIAGSCLSALSVVFLAIEGSDQACQAFHTLLSVGLVLGMAALLAKSHRGQQLTDLSAHTAARCLSLHLLCLSSATEVILRSLLVVSP